MLKIGFDAKRLFHNFTGLGNYSRTLVGDLQHFYPQVEYHLFTPTIKKSERTRPFLDQPHFKIHTAKGNGAYWRSFSIKKDLIANDIQLYHGLSHEIPKGIQKTGIKSVVTIHDLVFKHYPNLFPVIDRKIYDWKFRYSCENADKIIAISENTKKDIIRFYKIPPDKIKVIYQTCAEQFKSETKNSLDPGIAQKYQIPEDYLLYVGSVTERKNLLQIVQSLSLFTKESRPALVVLGDGKSYKKKVLQYIRKHQLENFVYFPEKLDFADFPALYKQAKALIYPSSYEGFGIPVIESLFCKTPVITTKLSSLPEAAGPGAYYLERPEPEAIKAGIEEIIGNQEYADDLAQKGCQYVQRFQSESLAAQMMEVYNRLLE